MNLINKIHYDHDKIILLIFDIEALGTDESQLREPLFNRVKKEIVILQNAEQDVIYDVLEDHKKAEKLIEVLEQEQHEIVRYIQRLAQMPMNDERWFEVFEKFKALVFKHIETEESELFPKIEKLLKERDEQLYLELHNHKQEQWDVGVVVGAAELSGEFFKRVRERQFTGYT